MSTSVTYNNVTFRNVKTESFDEQAVYDDSGTDLLYHRFTITIVGYVSTIYQASTVDISTNLETTTASNQITARTLCMEPRKNFLMTVGGATLLGVAPNNGSQSHPFGDVNNGPKPKSFKILGIYGAATMRVQFEIELCVVECANNTNVYGVLSNRWSMRDSIDVNFYTTRTITGRLRVVDALLDPQQFRSWVIPPLEKGFRRENIECTTTPDGLTLDYTVTDKQVFAAAPGEATEWDGQHIRITGDGSLTHDEINLTLEGPKDADKANLIALGMAIVVEKTNIGQQNAWLEQASIIDHLNANKIEIRVRVQLNPAEGDTMKIFNLPRDKFAKPLEIEGYDKDASRVPSVFGTPSAAGLWVSYLQSPCNDQHRIGDSVGSTAENEGIPSVATTSTYEYDGEIPPNEDSPGNYNTEQSQFTYTHYEMTSSYEQQHNTIRLPLSGSNSYQFPSATSGGGSTPRRRPSDADCIFVQMAPPALKRTVRVLAQRVGAWPLMPDINQITIGGQPVVPIGASITEPRTPRLTADGVTKLYEIEQVFTVGVTKTPVNQDLEVGHMPWDSSDVAANALPVGIFVGGLA